MTATPEPAKPPFTLPFRVRRGTGILEDADGMRVCNLGSDEAAQWLATRLNAPLAGELTEEERGQVVVAECISTEPYGSLSHAVIAGSIRQLIAIITRLTGATR